MFDLVTFVKDRNIHHMFDGHHHCKQGWMQIHCPKPQCAGGTGGYHLGFNLERGNLNCWRCGKITLRELLEYHAPDESLRELFHKYETRGEVKPTQIQSRVRNRVSKISLPEDVGPLLRPHIEYLQKRRFLPSMLYDQWGVRGIGPLGGAAAWSLFIPIYDHNANLVTYQTRSIKKDDGSKYVLCSTEKSIKSPHELLYAEHHIKGDAVVIMEGVIDVWRFGSGAVATFGVSWSELQALRLSHFHRRYVLFDSDRAATHQAYKLAKWLSGFPGITEIITIEESDPGSMSDKSVRKLRKELEIE